MTAKAMQSLDCEISAFRHRLLDEVVDFVPAPDDVTEIVLQALQQES